MSRLFAVLGLAFLLTAQACGGSSAPSVATSPTPTCTDAEAVARVRPSVVQVYAEGFATSTIGTGVVVGPNGLVLTAAHVVEGVSRVSVIPDNLVVARQKDSARFRGVVMARRPDLDLALIVGVSATAMPAVSLTDETILKPGERVLALGYPPGTDHAASLVGGLFSGLFTKDNLTYIGTDAPVTHGNSGGPLFTQCGAVVGIVSFGSKGSATDNYAVAAAHVRAFLSEYASRASSSTASTPPPVPPVVRETVRTTPQPTVRVTVATPAPIRATATPAQVAASRSTTDPFEFCALVGTADWPVEEYQGAVRYTGDPYLFPGRVFRCWSGKVLTCETGASGGLCMTLNRSSTPDQYLRDWCRENPNTTNLPFAVIGHGPRLYTWACAGGLPIITGRRSTNDIDALGYIIGVWEEATRASSYQPTSADAAAMVAVVRAFYAALAGKQYATAYQRLSKEAQAKAPFEQWVAGYTTTESIVVEKVEMVSGTSLVGVSILATDRTSTGQITRRFAGEWELVREAGEFKLHQGRIRAVQ